MLSQRALSYGRVDLINQIIQERFGVEPNTHTFTYSEMLFIIKELFDKESTEYLKPDNFNYGYRKFKEFVKMMFHRNLADYDSMIVLTAVKGTGKSSMALMLAREWCKIMGVRLSLKKNIVFSNKQLINAIDTLPPYSVIVCDEAVNFCLSSEWAKSENKELKKKLAQVRTKHFFFILCFPMKIQKIEKTYLDSFVNYWIEIPFRGQAIVFTRDNNPVNDSWRLKDFNMVGNYNDFTNSEAITAALKKHPNFWSDMRIPPCPPLLYERYKNQVREINVYSQGDLADNISQQDIHRSLLLLTLKYIMTSDTNISMNIVLKEIKLKYGISMTKMQMDILMKDADDIVSKIMESNQLRTERLSKNVKKIDDDSATSVEDEA